MSRKKKQPSPLSSLFTKQQPKTNHKVRNGAIGLGVVGGILAAFSSYSKKVKP